MALDPSGKAAVILGNCGTGRVVHHRHTFCQRFAYGRRAAQDKRQQTVAQLLAEHLADIEVKRKRSQANKFVNAAFELLKKLKFTNAKLLNLPSNLNDDWISKGYPLE